MYRLALLVAVCACGAQVGGGGGDIDATDGKPIDGSLPPADAPVDARACVGGDKSATAPDGSCLLFFTGPKTFADARAACETNATHLAILNDAALDTFAEDFVGTADTFIGLNDLAAEGTFGWIDGTPLVFTNWHTGEPNNGSGQYEEDCAVIAGARIGKQWDDRPCAPDPTVGGGSYAYLCQF